MDSSPNVISMELISLSKGVIVQCFRKCFILKMGMSKYLLEIVKLLFARLPVYCNNSCEAWMLLSSVESKVRLVK